MDRWEVDPLASVGKIEFGMSREDVHNLFDEKCKEFKKTKFSQNTADDYGNFHVFYTSDDTVEAVEFFNGIELLMDDEVIFPIMVDDIENRISGIEREGNSYTHIEKSIGIETDSTRAESILIGNKGYYD